MRAKTILFHLSLVLAHRYTISLSDISRGCPARYKLGQDEYTAREIQSVGREKTV